ncbi:MAG: hypothetical protein RL215_1175, partial [Planctomycetota bacterium]
MAPIADRNAVHGTDCTQLGVCPQVHQLQGGRGAWHRSQLPHEDVAIANRHDRHYCQFRYNRQKQYNARGSPASMARGLSPLTNHEVEGVASAWQADGRPAGVRLSLRRRNRQQ